MTRPLSQEQLDTLAEIAADVEERLAAEDAAARVAQETAEPKPA